NQAMFKIDELELTSRLIEGKFPDYEKIIPKSTRTKLVARVDKLNNATRRVNLFAKENNNSIKLSVTNDGRMQISTDETRIGEENEEVEVKIQGENNKVAINAQYLMDVLNRLKDSVIIEMSEKLTPVLVKPEKGDGYVYIIMPLKV
ncbi:MAG: DNA polymerase III subunit beta, partial [Patescibacteria group bacterium]